MRKTTVLAALVCACSHSSGGDFQLPSFPVQSTVDEETSADLVLTLSLGHARVEAGERAVAVERSDAPAGLDQELFDALRHAMEKAGESDGVLALRIDAGTPYRQVSSALYTAGQAGVTRFLFELEDTDGNVARHRLLRPGLSERCRKDAAVLSSPVECSRVDTRIAADGAVTLTPELASGDACVTAANDPRAPAPVTLDGPVTAELVQPLFAEAAPCPGIRIEPADSVPWGRVAEVTAAQLIAGARVAQATGFEPTLGEALPASAVVFAFSGAD